MQDDEIERTLCQLPQVHVFRIPAQKSAEGHRASDWPKDPNWSGKLKIVAKGRTAAIILFDDRNQVFAVCHVTDDSAVQKVLDSGRYFVLRITNQQGRHAFIGIAFNERNDAFDFNVALSEFRNELEREQNASKFFAEHSNPIDLTLKEGEKIKIKLNTKKADGANSTSKQKAGEISLLPPPDMRGSTAAVVNGGNPPSQSITNDPFASDPFGWGDSKSSSSSDPFTSFATSSSSDPFEFPTSGVTNGNTSSNSSSLLDF